MNENLIEVPDEFKKKPWRSDWLEWVWRVWLIGTLLGCFWYSQEISALFQMFLPFSLHSTRKPDALELNPLHWFLYWFFCFTCAVVAWVWLNQAICIFYELSVWVHERRASMEKRSGKRPG